MLSLPVVGGVVPGDGVSRKPSVPPAIRLSSGAEADPDGSGVPLLPV